MLGGAGLRRSSSATPEPDRGGRAVVSMPTGGGRTATLSPRRSCVPVLPSPLFSKPGAIDGGSSRTAK
eukprot:1651387-Rhodomonas_salina.1